MSQNFFFPVASLKGLHWLDWTTLAVYALMMLGIGWYYAVRTKSVDDFMLGNRTMNSWFVGLSMFVTYMSILSYLAIPGEMVRYGPLFQGKILAYPIVFAVVAIWIIPFAMRRKIVSAYELLEERFGSGIRLFASSLFLIQRLLWMGVIIFAVVDKILIPIFNVPPEWMPYICVGLGLFTAIYSTMGGLKAVVVTDVIQSFILLVGAVIAIGYLFWLTGGSMSTIWPDQWPAHWPSKDIWLGSIESRVSVFDMFLAYLIWAIATAGSDQMSIQRYLAMGSVSKARKMYGISLGADAIVTILLGVVGTGLLAYYIANPGMLPGEGYINGAKADQLFPLFILDQLPIGLSGLLVAAILAAAMSSLSSGINSSSSVILIDFYERLFQCHTSDPKKRVLYARVISMAIGLVVVALSILVAGAKGNLMEICGRVVNLLVGPLFVAFCLAIFIPWSSKRGVWIATVVSLFLALFIAFPWAFGKIATMIGLTTVSEKLISLEIGFNWITIASLAVGISLGIIISPLFPDKRKRFQL